ncbi:MAG: UvrD-helicase domain-containing protein, partial [Tissierellia bacterium]|nr:UvrD-helicase domain-containing protein [Tissierellia bacterium]
MKNTVDQELAITSIDDNIIVNAGAGTGKTKVLTERYIHILENGSLERDREIESIVAITFTKKATQEMKERIRKAIRDRFHLDNCWRRYYKDMEKANISTIHSFCGSILRDNALEANIDPMFETLDEDEVNLLLEESILKVILRGIEDEKNVYDMVRALSGDDLNRIVHQLKGIYYKIRCMGHSFSSIRDITLDSIDSIEVDLGDIQDIKDTFLYLMNNSRKNSKVYRLKNDDIWIDFYNDSYDRDELWTILEYLYDNIGRNAREKDVVERLENAICNILLMKEKEYRWLYEALLDTLIRIDEKYTRVKDELGVLDFDDLQILVLRLLDDEGVRKRYQDKFKYIMIDEFQDTNELQKQIFYRLCSERETL